MEGPLSIHVVTWLSSLSPFTYLLSSFTEKYHLESPSFLFSHASISLQTTVPILNVPNPKPYPLTQAQLSSLVFVIFPLPYKVCRILEPLQFLKFSPSNLSSLLQTLCSSFSFMPRVSKIFDIFYIP